MKKLFPHLFVLFGFIVLFSMGTWQLKRLEWKESLVAKIEKRMSMPPITLSDIKNIDEAEYRLVKLSGKYLHDKEMIILGRPFNGKPGQHVLTPLVTEDGKTIIVNRGWVKYEEDYSKPEFAEGAEGIIRKTQKLNFLSNMIIQKNNPKTGVWFYVDLPQIYAHLNAPKQDFYLELASTQKPNSYPYALEKKINIYNEHLNYAITWYALSFALLLVYYFRFWKK